MSAGKQGPHGLDRTCTEIRGTWHRDTQIQALILPLTHYDLPFVSYLSADLACKTGKTIPALLTLREDDLYESIM